MEFSLGPPLQRRTGHCVFLFILGFLLFFFFRFVPTPGWRDASSCQKSAIHFAAGRSTKQVKLGTAVIPAPPLSLARAASRVGAALIVFSPHKYFADRLDFPFRLVRGKGFALRKRESVRSPPKSPSTHTHTHTHKRKPSQIRGSSTANSANLDEKKKEDGYFQIRRECPSPHSFKYCACHHIQTDSSRFFSRLGPVIIFLKKYDSNCKLFSIKSCRPVSWFSASQWNVSFSSREFLKNFLIFAHFF